MRQKFLRSSYNYDVDQASNESALTCPEESLAIQSAEEESNINTIVRRFGLTGQLPDNVNMPVSGDFSGVVDFHSAMNLIRKAQEEFLNVPADIRARFNNDPQRFMDFLEDTSNRDEAMRMGLLKPAPVSPEPLSVRVVQDQPAQNS